MGGAKKMNSKKITLESSGSSVLPEEEDGMKTTKSNIRVSTHINTMEKRNSIRIGLVGCVSCGKSTLLNSICVNQYEEMKKCRTTMLPSVYKETNKTIYNTKSEKQKILEMNKVNNQNIFNGDVKLSNGNCKAVDNMIPKINDFTELPENIYLDIYDIPGLNDGETKEIYYKWIEDNFSELDIIVHIIDINSPLNTSDQTEILKMLIKNINDEKTKNGREVFLLTLVNKCDEMDQGSDGEFEMDDEDQTNYDYIIKKTYETIKEVTGEDVFKADHTARRSGKVTHKNSNYAFSPISAADTFVYRMLHNDPNVKMDMKLLQKFGVNEVGRRIWNKMDEKEKRDMISEHFSKVDISDTLEITGYNRFTSIMKSYLTKEKQSNILINRIRTELSKEEMINKNITTDKEELKKLIEIYNSYCAKVMVIDKLYDTDNSGVIAELINQHIYRWINQISDISNDSEGSVIRLQEYKDIINKLNNSINKYVLKNIVPVSIDVEKNKRWSDSFGFNVDTLKNISIKSTLNYLFGGYSMLQNEYYVKKLCEMSTYQNEFPRQVFENIDALRENACDSVESIIDEVLNSIVGWLGGGNWSSDEKTPISGYYEVDKDNTTVLFCKTLIEWYNYPKEKVIGFLKKYTLYRYTIGTNSYLEQGACCHTGQTDKCELQKTTQYVHSYTILFDDWFSSHSETILKPSFWQGIDNYVFMKNLYYINKSYLNTSTNLDTTLDYYSKEDGILAIPQYMCSLMISCEDLCTDSEEYSSVDEE